LDREQGRVPDQDGRLTREEKDRFIAWAAKHEAGKPNAGVCPQCKSNQWLIADHLVQPVTLKGNTMQLGQSIGYPQVMLISEPCGLTWFFNAVLCGIVTPDESPTTPATPAPPKEG
jgi:hypothetical protein